MYSFSSPMISRNTARIVPGFITLFPLFGYRKKYSWRFSRMISARIVSEIPPSIYSECILTHIFENFSKNSSRELFIGYIMEVSEEISQKFILKSFHGFPQKKSSWGSLSDSLGKYFMDCYESSCMFFLETFLKAFLPIYYPNSLQGFFFRSSSRHFLNTSMNLSKDIFKR